MTEPLLFAEQTAEVLGHVAEPAPAAGEGLVELAADGRRQFALDERKHGFDGAAGLFGREAGLLRDLRDELVHGTPSEAGGWVGRTPVFQPPRGALSTRKRLG